VEINGIEFKDHMTGLDYLALELEQPDLKFNYNFSLEFCKRMTDLTEEELMTEMNPFQVIGAAKQALEVYVGSFLAPAPPKKKNSTSS
jgi:hypothetical protein